MQKPTENYIKELQEKEKQGYKLTSTDYKVISKLWMQEFKDKIKKIPKKIGEFICFKLFNGT